LVGGGISGFSQEKEIIGDQGDNSTMWKEVHVPVHSADDKSLVIRNDSTDLLCNSKNDVIPPIQDFEHKISKITKRIPKTRSVDFMDVEYCTTGSTVKTDNSLILVQQNIRGTVSKTCDTIGSFWIDKTNPQVLCFTDHTLNGNLCLTNIENYVLGSNFS
jgi:hypothetical protein